MLFDRRTGAVVPGAGFPTRLDGGSEGASAVRFSACGASTMVIHLGHGAAARSCDRSDGNASVKSITVFRLPHCLHAEMALPISITKCERRASASDDRTANS